MVVPLMPMGMVAPADFGGGGYSRTAFVASAGNDGTAVLNNPSQPYATIQAAIDALAGAYSSQPTTIRFIDNYSAAGTSPSDNMNSLLVAGLTMRGHTGTVSVSADLALSSQNNANWDVMSLALAQITVQRFYSDHTSGSVDSIGTITGDAATTITTLDLNGTDGAAGTDAGTGWDQTGGNGTYGSDGMPPTDGGNGGNADASASSNGGSGTSGNRAWNLTISGATTFSQLNATGGAGGPGGNGGSGAAAFGGNGGNGGNAQDDGNDTPYNGGNGGNGGDATSNGSSGGDGGNGGDGGTITRSSFTGAITSSNLAGGVAGAGGGGGSAGTANGGSGGIHGRGINGGSDGTDGTPGNSTANAGSSGGTSAPGGDGSII